LDLLARLVESARTGEPHAFAALAEELRPNIFQLTSRFARTPHDFDDLSQEICLRLWKSLPSLRDSSRFLGWFKPLAVRTCYDWLRRRRTRQDHEVSHESLAALGEMPVEAVPTTEASERAAEIIHTAMAALKPDERLVLTLLELEDHSVAETAALTGWSEANVKVRAHRARAALKRVLFAQRKIMANLPK
jgi:RNA polymerase sigma-70 factor, ECF subfamily